MVRAEQLAVIFRDLYPVNSCLRKYVYLINKYSIHTHSLFIMALEAHINEDMFIINTKTEWIMDLTFKQHVV